MITWQTALDLYLQEAESAQRKSRITRPAGSTTVVVKRPAKKYTLVEPPPPPPAVSANRASSSSLPSSSRMAPLPVVYFSPSALSSHAPMEPTAPEALTSLQDLLHLEAAVLKDHRFRLHKLRSLGSQRASEWALWDSEDALRSDPSLTHGDIDIDVDIRGGEDRDQDKDAVARPLEPMRGPTGAASAEVDESSGSAFASASAATGTESRARRRARLAQLLSAFDSRDAGASEVSQLHESHASDPRAASLSWSKTDISARYIDSLLGLAE